MRSSVRAEAAGRLLFIDNLRWTMILLVISMHAADTYSPLGNWYFTDRKPLSAGSLLFFAVWQTYLQSFFMGLLFFVAGLFVLGSFDRKGPASFLRDRAYRLGLPVLFYMFVLGPVTEYFVAHSWTSSDPTSFPHEWWKHIQNGEVLQENGPLWFCLALLLFSTGFALSGFARKRSIGDQAPPGLSTLLVFVLAMASFAFVIRAAGPPSLFNLPLKDFAQYVLLFSAGVLAARRDWLATMRYRDGMRWLLSVLVVGFPAWLALLVWGGALEGKGATFTGGWHWQNAAFALWESMTCVGVCYGLLVLYRERCNRQGPLARFLSENAFSVYVFHPPILIGAARLLQGVVWYPIVKFGLLTAIAASASFVLSAAVFRRIPVLQRIL